MYIFMKRRKKTTRGTFPMLNVEHCLKYIDLEVPRSQSFEKQVKVELIKDEYEKNSRGKRIWAIRILLCNPVKLYIYQMELLVNITRGYNSVVYCVLCADIMCRRTLWTLNYYKYRKSSNRTSGVLFQDLIQPLGFY